MAYRLLVSNMRNVGSSSSKACAHGTGRKGDGGRGGMEGREELYNI